ERDRLFKFGARFLGFSARSVEPAEIGVRLGALRVEELSLDIFLQGLVEAGALRSRQRALDLTRERAGGFYPHEPGLVVEERRKRFEPRPGVRLREHADCC